MIGTMSHIIKGNIISPNQGSLYRVDNNLKPELMISPVTISNGLAWNSQDDTFYYIDSPTRQVAGYDYDPHNGTICKKLFIIFNFFVQNIIILCLYNLYIAANRRIIFDMNETNLEGIPDGMTIDTDDNLWIALYSGSHVSTQDGAVKMYDYLLKLLLLDINTYIFYILICHTLNVLTIEFIQCITRNKFHKILHLTFTYTYLCQNDLVTRIILMVGHTGRSKNRNVIEKDRDSG